MDEKIDRLNARYAEYRAAGRPGWSTDYALKRKRLDRVLAKPFVPRTGRFLEIGCGAGNVALYAAEKGFEAYGIDFSPDAIDWAREILAGSSLAADFRVGSVLDLDREYPAGFFDVVYDGDCLFMILRRDRPACLKGIFNVLRPGGYFRARAHLARPEVTERRQIQPDRYYDPETRTVVVDGVPIYQYSLREEFVAEIESAGFAVVNEEVYDPKPGNHPVLEAFMWVDAVRPNTQPRAVTDSGGSEAR
jgi:SAM-dependent methyltransferase